MKSQRTSLNPISKLTDTVIDIKHKLDEAQDMSRAVVTPQDHPEAGVPGLGEEDVMVIFQPLLSSPRVPLERDDGDLDLYEIEGLTPQQVEGIQEKAKPIAKRIGKL